MLIYSLKFVSPITSKASNTDAETETTVKEDSKEKHISKVKIFTHNFFIVLYLLSC